MSNGPTAPHALSTLSTQSVINESSGQANSPILHRSASHTQLLETDTSQSAPSRRSSLNRSFSENVLPNALGNATQKSSVKQGTRSGTQRRRSFRRLGSLKRRSLAHEPEPQFTISKFIIGADESLDDVGYESPVRKEKSRPAPPRKTYSVSGSLSNFARKPWASRSPSPSPSKGRLRKGSDSVPKTKNDNAKPIEPGTASAAVNEPAQDITNGVARRNSILGRKSKRPLSSLLSKTSNDLGTPSVPLIPKSFSTEKLPISAHAISTPKGAPALPESKSFERFQNLGVETPRKKDELWGVFRNVDAEYQKFQSRPGTSKTAVIRSALLPFLRTYAEHHSITPLRPEDLDRRTVILNKWWTGLLEMLNGRRGESVSGNDRPAVLEAVTALMIRPEWTLPSSMNISRPSKTPWASLKSRSTTSLGSTMTMSSDFLAESVHHNVRNTFTQNLLAQMAYVVDKMSTRNVAASVVAFCGKATAYAFFYCEGVAEILVRLWAISSDTMKRVITEHGGPRDSALDSISDRICNLFPPNIRSLTFKSLRSMKNHLRDRPHVPFATAYIPWHGPWVGRWAGKDTDLFYVFAKFYTDLACRFLPEDPSVEETIVAPGWVLVQAQTLSILDTTAQRVGNQSMNERSNSSAVTFDAMFEEADASAAVLPLPANAATRSMAENRFILLLRDCLSGSTIMTVKAQSLFARSSNLVIKGAARRISVFDHNACFTLCDFLEEALAILSRYHQTSGSTVAAIDWDFWLHVCKHMLQSHNIMTQVRLCAFLYAMWPTLVDDVDIKRELCLHWLLREEVFRSLFSHWCPMVRAFFMRLLAWRIARVDWEQSELDMAIIESLAERLRVSWGQFVYNQQKVGTTTTAAPSTPAPGRRLLIMRNDSQPAPAGMFLSFDGILSSSSISKVNPYEKHSSIDPLSRATSGHFTKGPDNRNSSSDNGRRRWSLFKTFLPSSSTSSNRGGSGLSPYSYINSKGSRTDLKQNQQGPTGSKSTIAGPAGSAPSYRSLSFKFSLEWVEREGDIFGKEEMLYPPKLPLLAQTAFDSRQDQVVDPGLQEPTGASSEYSKYTGKALAEWALLIFEYRNFFERRKAEGVPSYQMVETPTLGVEPFRKL